MRTLSIILLVAAIGMFSCRKSNSTGTNSLVGKWGLRTLPDTTFSLPGGTIYVQMNIQGLVDGEGGCNSFKGTYTADNNKLVFGDLTSTLMWCTYGDLETRFMTALRNTDSYTMSKGMLILYHGGTQLATLTLIP